MKSIIEEYYMILRTNYTYLLALDRVSGAWCSRSMFHLDLCNWNKSVALHHISCALIKCEAQRKGKAADRKRTRLRQFSQARVEICPRARFFLVAAPEVAISPPPGSTWILCRSSRRSIRAPQTWSHTLMKNSRIAHRFRLAPSER